MSVGPYKWDCYQRFSSFNTLHNSLTATAPGADPNSTIVVFVEVCIHSSSNIRSSNILSSNILSSNILSSTSSSIDRRQLEYN